MRDTARARTRTENRCLLAVTLACYLAAFACVLAASYSLAALAAPGLGRQTAAVTAPYAR